MSAPNLSIHSVLDRLAEGPWRLNGLPTIGGSGLYFVALELGAAPTYAWFSLSKNLSAARTSFFDRDEAFAFLTEYAKDGYDESLFDVWDDGSNPTAGELRSALRRTQRLMDELRAHAGSFARAMETGWLQRTDDLGWLATKPYEKGPAQIQCSETRAASELLTHILVHEAELERGEPPAELAAFIADARERRARLFSEHGPSTDRLLLRSRAGEPSRGLMRFANGLHAMLELDEGDALRKAELLPDDHAFDLLAQELRSVVPPESASIPKDALASAERLLDLDDLTAWHGSGAIRMRCGKLARGGLVTVDPMTLLDDLTETRLGVREALERFGGGRGFVAIELTPQLSPSEQARSANDPNSPAVRYLFPEVWLHRFSKDRVFELAFGTALTTAVGSDATLARQERRVDRGEQRAHGLRVTLRAGPAKVVIDEEPIESGHGVHGARVRATFSGLPGGLSIRGTGHIDMRTGGRVDIEIEGDPDQHIKRQVLDALP